MADMLNPGALAGATGARETAKASQAGGQDRGEHTARTRKPQGDAFVAAKFAWLERVAGDADLRHSAVRVAVILSSYMSRDHGCAWPSVERLCSDTGLSERALRYALDHLDRRGHLDRERGGGKARTSEYRMKGCTALHRNGSKGCKSVHPNDALRVQGRADKGCKSVHPIPFNETFERDTDSLFADFWQHYPRRDDPKAAKRAFKKAVKEGARPADLMAGAMRYAAERDGQPKRYTKLAATWLNAGSWMNEPGDEETPDTKGNRMSAAEFAARRAEEIESGGWQ